MRTLLKTKLITVLTAAIRRSEGGTRPTAVMTLAQPFAPLTGFSVVDELSGTPGQE